MAIYSSKPFSTKQTSLYTRKIVSLAKIKFDANKQANHQTNDHHDCDTKVNWRNDGDEHQKTID